MYYIVGLGNPGDEYEETRHNVGRMAVLSLAKKFGDISGSGKAIESGFKYDKVLDALKLKVDIDGESTTLIAPNTFMNKSGKSVAPLINAATKPLTEKKAAKLIVIHDDIDLPLGKVKIVFNRGTGGNNGVESIKRAIKTEAFVRIKIGIVPTTPTGKLKKPASGDKVVDFILGKFQAAEMLALKKTMKDMPDIVSAIISKGHLEAMNEFN